MFAFVTEKLHDIPAAKQSAKLALRFYLKLCSCLWHINVKSTLSFAFHFALLENQNRGAEG